MIKKPLLTGGLYYKYTNIQSFCEVNEQQFKKERLARSWTILYSITTLRCIATPILIITSTSDLQPSTADLQPSTAISNQLPGQLVSTKIQAKGI